MPGSPSAREQTGEMSTPSKDRARGERIREHAATVERARAVISTLGQLVRGREARGTRDDPPLEIQFSRTEVDGRSLPAAVWVALRRDDVGAAVEAMTSASQTRFTLEEREVIGEGYRLEAVQDSLPLPETDLLAAQLSRMLDIPLDVLTVIAEWGPEDPRAESETDALLTTRFGPAARRSSPDTTITAERHRQSPITEGRSSGSLTMTVSDFAQVLRLDDEQARALGVLVRTATVRLVAN